jgi:hypothetical protein
LRLFSTDACNRLPAADSDAAKALISDLEYVHRSVEVGSSVLVGKAISLGVVELFQQLCRSLFHRGDLFVPTSTFTRQVTSAALSIGTTLTDGSRDACRQVLNIELHKDLFAYLRSDDLDPVKVEYGEWRGYVADCFLAMLYNVIQVGLAQLNEQITLIINH